MNKNDAISGLIWKICERFANQIVSFVVTLVLARLLTPDDYGLVSIVLAIVAILQVFVDSGMATSLVQKKSADDLDFGTVFVSNVCISLVLYVLIFFGAPLLSSFYEKDLTNLIRVLSLIILIYGVKNSYQTYAIRALKMKTIFTSSLSGITIGGLLGIALAYGGAGTWAIVAQQLVSELICTAALALQLRWRPKIAFSAERFGAIFSFGWKLLLSSLIDTVYNNIRQLIVGKYYSSSDLAYYSKGEQFPNLIVNNINASMNTVLLPVMAQHQDNSSEVKRVTRMIIRTSSYVIWPMMIGMFVVADSLIEVLLTSTWASTVPYLRVFCLVYCLQPLQTTNLSVMKALGRTDLCLKLEVIKKSIALVIVLISAQYGPLAIAVGALIYSVIASILNASPCKKLIGYSYLEQIKDILPYIELSAVMGVCVWFARVDSFPAIVNLVLQVLVGVAVYVALSLILKLDSFQFLLQMVLKLFKKDDGKNG